MALKRVFGALFSPKWLFVTNTTTGALFLGAGDVIEQRLIERRLLALDHRFDAKRTVGMTAAGLYFGSLGHFWYAFLDRRFPASLRRALPKKLLCEAAVGPPFGASVFLIVGRLEGQSLADIWRQLKHNFTLLCLADWCVFIPLQTLNFVFLSPRFRLLFVAVVSLFYDVFLSFVLHARKEPTDGATQ